jgi:hypothetical protein
LLPFYTLNFFGSSLKISSQTIDLVLIDQQSVGKRSEKHYQREKAMDDYLLACHQILEREPRSDMPCERASII